MPFLASHQLAVGMVYLRRLWPRVLPPQHVARDTPTPRRAIRLKRLAPALVVAFFSILGEGLGTTYAVSLQFAGRTWEVKASSSPVGPGPNLFSDDPEHVWSDGEGLHLSIRQSGSAWYSTEVISTESLGYGAYLFQTDSRQDVLDPNAVFGAFTWDPFGGSPIPGDPHREIDFEDSRWGDPLAELNSTVTVQPYSVSGNSEAFALPDLSSDAALTRILSWTPGKVVFTTLAGHHSLFSYSDSDVIHQSIYLDNGEDHRVPIPDRETFRFNLWLTGSSVPHGGQPVDVLVNQFRHYPSPPSGDLVLFDFESGDQGWGSFGAIGTDSGLLPTGGSNGQGRFHSANFGLPDTDFGIVDVSPSGQDLSPFAGLAIDARFTDVVGQPDFVGSKLLNVAIQKSTGEEFFAPAVGMTDTYRTFELAFSDFQSGSTGLSPTPTDLSDSTIKLIVFNANGTGVGVLGYDEVTGVGSFTLDGDYNTDGVVDAADYAVWRDSVGSTTRLYADGDFSGVIDAADYNVWASNFGGAKATIASAPEPSAAVLLMLASLWRSSLGARGRRA